MMGTVSLLSRSGVNERSHHQHLTGTVSLLSRSAVTRSDRSESQGRQPRARCLNERSHHQHLMGTVSLLSRSAVTRSDRSQPQPRAGCQHDDARSPTQIFAVTKPAAPDTTAVTGGALHGAIRHQLRAPAACTTSEAKP